MFSMFSLRTGARLGPEHGQYSEVEGLICGPVAAV